MLNGLKEFMAKLADKFSIAKPVEVVSSGGHLVRPVDVNGVAIDDGVTQYSVAHPVVEVDATGTVKADSTKIFSTHKKVTVSPIGTPVVTTGPTGTTTGTTLGGGGGAAPALKFNVAANSQYISLIS